MLTKWPFLRKKPSHSLKFDLMKRDYQRSNRKQRQIIFFLVKRVYLMKRKSILSNDLHCIKWHPAAKLYHILYEVDLYFPNRWDSRLILDLTNSIRKKRKTSIKMKISFTFKYQCEPLIRCDDLIFFVNVN